MLDRIDAITGLRGTASFREHTRIAAEAAEELGTDLAVVLVRAPGISGERRLRRVAAQLRGAEGFAYRLGEDCFAVLLPGSTAWTAFKWVLDARAALSSGLQRRIPIQAGVAGYAPGTDAGELLKRASSGLARAEAARCPAWLERCEPAHTLV